MGVAARIRWLAGAAALAAAWALPAGGAASRTPGDAPLAISFPTAQRGYVLSLASCGRAACATMSTTTDGGSTWRPVTVPAPLRGGVVVPWLGDRETGSEPIAVHFADARDGWITAALSLPATPSAPTGAVVFKMWSTHDAAASWTSIPLSRLDVGGGVIAMATHGPRTYLFGTSSRNDRTHVLVSPSTGDRWANAARFALFQPAGGTALEGWFAFSGAQGWFVSGNDRYLALERLARDGTWIRATTTSAAPGNASAAPLVPVAPGLLAIVAHTAGFVTPPTNSVPRDWNDGATWLFTSRDGGRTFQPVRELSASYQVTFPAIAGLPAIPRPGTILLVRDVGGASQLVRTTDWGARWRVVLHRAVSQVAFVSARVGYALTSPTASPLRATLLRTVDGGARWTSVALGSSG